MNQLKPPRTITTLSGNSQNQHRIDLGCRAMLVREGDRNILVETGIGAFFSPELKKRFGVVEERHVLLDKLAAMGLSDADIDVVVLTHLHFDHAGGLLAAYEEGSAPRLLFPNARFITGRRQWARACQPHSRDRASYIPELIQLLEASGRLELLDDGEASSTLGSDWRFHVSDGHTPGQLLPEVAMPSGPVVFAGDLVPGVAWVHVPITMGYDRFPEQLIDEKTALLAELVARNGRLVFTHDPAIAIGRVTRDGNGRFSVSECAENVTALAA